MHVSAYGSFLKNMNMHKRYITFAILACLFIIALFVAYAVFRESDRMLRLTFLHAGAGDAVLVRSPSGNYILINAGADASILRALGRALPFYVHTLDLVITTDHAIGHIGGLPKVLDAYAVKRYVSLGSAGDTVSQRAAQEIIAANHIASDTLYEGDSINLGGGARLSALFVAMQVRAHEQSVVQLAYGKTHAAFISGHIDQSAILRLGIRLRSDIADLNTIAVFSPELFSAIAPAYVIAPSGTNFNASTTDFFSTLKTAVISTASGEASFSSDGEEFQAL